MEDIWLADHLGYPPHLCTTEIDNENIQKGWEEQLGIETQ